MGELAVHVDAVLGDSLKGIVFFFLVYDVAWVRPFGMRHVITADSLMVWSSAGCAHKSHLGGTGAIQKFEV